MAKSTGNFIKLKDVVVDYESGYILKYLMLSTHYRQPLNFSPQKWNDAANNVKKIKNFFIQYKHYYDGPAYEKFLEKDHQDLLESVANDFNTVQGLMDVHRWIKQFKTMDSLSIQEASTCFFNILFILESLGLQVKI
jgi:cysteinyl-tRNA synthetase